MPDKAPVATNTDLYATDFSAWCLTTAALVRAGAWDDIDLEALGEELESLGKSQKRELEHRLEGLVMHLLKWVYQPERRQESHSWYDTIREHRSQLALLLRDNPSLKSQVTPILAEVYPGARSWAVGEMTSYIREKQPRRSMQPGAAAQAQDVLDRLERFPPPPHCPWTTEQILDQDFWP